MNVITTLFFDLGGVVLTNGWDFYGRKAAAEHFKINLDDFEARHDKIYQDSEKGFISLNDYVDKVVFYEKRNFGKEDFIQFMKGRSKPQKNSIEVLEKLAGKGKYFLATINNESYELNQHRIQKNKLNKYFKVFFSSGFLGVRKPEPRIFQTALNVSQKKPEECLFIDDREENIEEAGKQGINTIHLPDINKLNQLLVEKGITI